MVHKSEKTTILLIFLGSVVFYYLLDNPLLLLLPGIAYILFKKIYVLIEKYYQNKANEEIPDFLYQISTYLQYMDLVESIGKTNTKYFNSKKLYDLLKNTNDPEKTIKQFSEEYPYFKKIQSIFLFVLKTGKDSKDIIKNLANSLKKRYLREKELEIGMLIEKYTLLFGGGILVPLILGTIFQFSISLDFSNLEEINKNIDYSLFYYSNVIYLSFYSIIVGLFLGRDNKIVTILLLLIISQVSFHFALNYQII